MTQLDIVIGNDENVLLCVWGVVELEGVHMAIPSKVDINFMTVPKEDAIIMRVVSKSDNEPKERLFNVLLSVEKHIEYINEIIKGSPIFFLNRSRPEYVDDNIAGAEFMLATMKSNGGVHYESNELTSFNLQLIMNAINGAKETRPVN